jgi:hypothetical protein
VYEGALEIHLTVSSWAADRLDEFAGERGIKVSQIELDHGEFRSQPMLTVELTGSLEDAEQRVAQLRRELAAAQLQAVRVKIETAPWNRDVPVTDDQAREDLYFEHHVKVRLPAGDAARRLEITALAREHDARVSRNARRVLDDGTEERFVTQRCFGVGRQTSRPRLDALLSALDEGGFEVLEVEEEYVVVDDNLGLDAGWMNRPAKNVGPSYGDLIDARVAQQLSYQRDSFPATFVPLVPAAGVRQHAVFEPALKQFTNAFKTGQPPSPTRSAPSSGPRRARPSGTMCSTSSHAHHGPRTWSCEAARRCTPGWETPRASPVTSTSSSRRTRPARKAHRRWQYWTTCVPPFPPTRALGCAPMTPPVRTSGLTSAPRAAAL